MHLHIYRDNFDILYIHRGIQEDIQCSGSRLFVYITIVMSQE